MTQTKIQGKFYPLQHDEWVRACQELTPAQRDVLYFIRTLDPYNMGLDITAAEIARQLSTPNRIVHRQTVSRALKELDRLGFIDLELISISIKVLPKGVHCQQVRANETPVVPGDTSGCDETPVVPGDTSGCDETPVGAMRHQARSLRTKRKPEASPDKDSNSLRSNKIYKDFIDSLSQDQREKFLEFGLKKARELPKPPTLPQKWVEQNCQELYEQFKKTPEGKKFATTQDWANHPRRDEWIEQIRQGKPRFIAQGGPAEERETRRLFADWAEANNLIWEAQS
ncbi:MAG TPA: helix-turn-helix domain-containing protein [Allocoleopsis sp.]